MPYFDRSGGLDTRVVTSLPATPVSGSTQYVRNFCGFPTWWTVDTSGRHRPDLSPFERGIQHYQVTPNVPGQSVEPIGTSGAHIDGHNATEINGFGTITHPALALTNLQTSLRRYTATSSTANNQFAGISAPNTGSAGFCVRSLTSPLGKLFLRLRWSWAGPITNTSFHFVGLLGALGSINDAVTVGALNTDDPATAPNLNFRTATGAGTPTQLALDGTISNGLGGLFAACPRSITEVYDTSIMFEAGTGLVGMRHYGASSQAVFYDGQVSATLPTVDTLLRWTVEGGNGTTGAAAIMHFYGMEAWVGEAE